MSLLRLALVVASATAAKKPPPKRVALVSFAAPWDYGPYAHQLRELAEHWLATHHVVWIGLSGTVDRIQYGAPKISPLVGYRGAGMSKDPVKKVSKLNRIFVLTQRPFLHVSELQHHEDGVSTISRHRDAVDVAVGASTACFVTVSCRAGKGKNRLRDHALRPEQRRRRRGLRDSDDCLVSVAYRGIGLGFCPCFKGV